MRLKSIQGLISASEIDIVNSITPLRFKRIEDFETPEALVLYEQGLLSNEQIMDCIKRDIGREYQTPTLSYIPREILDHFSNYEVVPIRYDNIADIIYVGVLYEHREKRVPAYKNKQIEKVYVPIHWFVENYTKLYSTPKFLAPIPIKDVFESIVSEAIAVEAADITISSRAYGAKVYYNVRKRNVSSKRSISKDNVKELADYISVIAKQPIADFTSAPRYLSVDLDTHHRGRVAVVNTYQGKSISIRVLPNSIFNVGLENLNLTENTISFIRNVCCNQEYGLRIVAGPTFSGKNTTIASALYEMLRNENKKAVSVEQPVELIMDFMEQMNSETEEDFALNVRSLLRQNPDVIYITEITDMTALETMNIANTGKVVFSTIHTNSASDIPARLQDLTKLSLDRIILNLHSLMFQELKRDEESDAIYPVNRCIYLDTELKDKLLGKSLGEVTKILREVESKWVS